MTKWVKHGYLKGSATNVEAHIWFDSVKNSERLCVIAVDKKGM